ncbi:MAG: response regulator [Proteobacteria bacterium]|nr:response regulator [Pseudomonadota bacterium]MBU1711171.1 response regulator [Pseudomonadota bacterium]
MGNILDELLGVEADRVQDTTTSELEELVKITHRDGRTHRKTQPAPEESATAAEKHLADGGGQKTLAPHADAAGTPLPAPVRKKGIPLFRFLDILKMELKNFRLEIQMADKEKGICNFVKGILVDDFFIGTPKKIINTGPKTVLLVDNDKSFLATLSASLKEYANKFTVLTAANGKLALRVLETAHVDLVVTALKMPEMDGFELMAHIQLNHSIVPFMAMSIFDFPEMHKRVNKLGGIKHLIKPIDPTELATHILEVLDAAGKESLKGSSLADFFSAQGIDMASSVIEIDFGDKTFICRIDNGLFQSAACGQLHGEQAVREILPWNNMTIKVKDIQ